MSTHKRSSNLRLEKVFAARRPLTEAVLEASSEKAGFFLVGKRAMNSDPVSRESNSVHALHPELLRTVTGHAAVYVHKTPPC